jgi:hypothetical protein
LRLATHDSGTGWLATPFLYGSFIHDSKPVYPGALNKLLVEGHNLIMVTSVMKSESDTAVRLVGQRAPLHPTGDPSSLFAEAFSQGLRKGFSGRIIESADKPGKLQVSIDGYPAPAGEFDTRNEAMACTRGFTVGFSTGGGIKNMADGFPPA